MLVYTVVEGCQMAMNCAVLLAGENRQLRAENERQKKMRVKRTAYIATGGVLSIQEGVEHSQTAEIVPERAEVNQGAGIQRRVPRRCGLCGSHKMRVSAK
jgi:hypothetical protein